MAGVLPPSWGKGTQMAHLQEVRAEVDGIINRIQSLMNLTSPNVMLIPDLLVLEEDLDRTCKHISLCTSEGHTWDRTYGCTKTEMTAWRALVKETLDELRNHDSEMHNADFAAKEDNSRLCEVDWPEEINSLTRQNCFMLWMEERESFTSVWQRCAHLMSALTPLDREHVAPPTNPDSIIYVLMVKYGSESHFVHCKIKELTNLKKPEYIYVKINYNMNTVKQNIGFILNLYKEQRLDSYTIKNIVNTAFVRQILKKHNMKYMQFKSQYITPGHFSLHFSSGLIHKLAFLICIIDQVLEYNSLLHHGVQAPSESCYQTHPQCLPPSDTLCRPCQTPHQDPKNGKGRKWHMGFCKPLLELTFEDKPSFLKTEYLCNVCTFSKASPICGNGITCPFTPGPL